MRASALKIFDKIYKNFSMKFAEAVLEGESEIKEIIKKLRDNHRATSMGDYFDINKCDRLQETILKTIDEYDNENYMVVFKYPK